MDKETKCLKKKFTLKLIGLILPWRELKQRGRILDFIHFLFLTICILAYLEVVSFSCFAQENQLINLAQKKFNKLNDAEKYFLKNTSAARETSLINYKNKTIRASLLEWLFTDTDVLKKKLITSKGVFLRYATIDDDLDLTGVIIPFPIVLRNCQIHGSLKLERAKCQMIDLKGTKVTNNIRARQVKVEGDMLLLKTE